MTELVCRLLYEAGLPPDYVLDRMRLYEVAPLLKHTDMRIRSSWEQARLGAFITAQANSTKKLKLTDIVAFPWEDEAPTPEDTRMSDEDLARLRREAKEFLKTQNHG